MSGDPRDPLDDAIARDLGALAPDELDADAVLGRLRPALHRARARRRLAVSSSVVGALVVVIGLGALLASQSPSHVHVQGHSTTLPVVSTTSRPNPSTTSTTRPPGKATSTTTGTTPSPGTTPTTGTTPTADNHGGTTQPGPGATTSPPAAPSTTTYTSIGGRITVTFADGSLTLDSSTPSAGYQTDVHNQAPDDIEVRFDNGNHESRIRIRVENGAIQKEITEN